MEALTTAELRGLCAKRALPTSGSKHELIERLVKSTHAPTSRATSNGKRRASIAPAAQNVGGSTIELFPREYGCLTLPQLKIVCRERGLATSGIKDDLVVRLTTTDPRSMTLEQLRAECRAAGLSQAGAKHALMYRVMDCIKERVRGCNNSGHSTKKAKHHSAAPLAIATKSMAIKARSYAAMGVPQLKDICKRRGLALDGRKEELLARLMGAKSELPPRSAESVRHEVPRPTTLLIERLTDCRPQVSAREPRLNSTQSTTTLGSTQIARHMSAQQAVVLPPSGVTIRDAGSRHVERPPRASCTAFESISDLLITANSLPPAAPNTALTPDISTSATVFEPSNSRTQGSTTLTTHCYVVQTTKGYTPDGFHTFQSPEIELHGIFSSTYDANNYVHEIFYHNNPWGWEEADFGHFTSFEGNGTIEKTHKSGLLTMSMEAGDSEEWTVQAKRIPAESIPSRTAVPYAICSSCGFLPDGFHTPESPTMEIYTALWSREAANKRVTEIFFLKNPWGWKRSQFQERRNYGWGNGMEKSYDDGLLSMTIHPDDSEEWRVYAKPLRKLLPTADMWKDGHASCTPNSTRGDGDVVATGLARIPHFQAQRLDQYVVYKSCTHIGKRSNINDRDDSNQEVGEVCVSKEEANKRVRDIFYSNNPWGLAQVSLDRVHKVEEMYKHGLLKLRVCPPGDSEWLVAAMREGSQSHNDVGSDEEDD